MQYVYTMRRRQQTVPPKRQILKTFRCRLSGRQDRCAGLNGSGKSSLMRIMAGEDAHFDGEAIRGRT